MFGAWTPHVQYDRHSADVPQIGPPEALPKLVFLFLCPARHVTDDELLRFPIPSSMETYLDEMEQCI